MNTSNATSLVEMGSALSPERRAQIEFTKDIWDIRVIPGAHYLDYSSSHLLNFTHVPLPFRSAVKQYLRSLIAANLSLGTCQLALLGIRSFLLHHVEQDPTATHLYALTAQDMEAYLLHLKATPLPDGRSRSQQHIDRYLNQVDRFLRYLQRIESPLAPHASIDKILWLKPTSQSFVQEHKKIKLIPQAVLEQLDQHLHQFPREYIPVVLLLRASGWRISDILTLRHDSCLERNERGWFLCGTIQKTRVLGHRVPITEEVAAVIQAQRELLLRKVPEQDNPKRYLFPAMLHSNPRSGSMRAGRPLGVRSLERALKRFVKTYQIQDEWGNLFSLTTHAFRHTKAVELLNNGLPLTYVQQWMAHASPEMTLVYARLLDETMQRKWEETMAQGVIHIGGDGIPRVVKPEEVLQGNELELAFVRANLDAIRLPNGYCFKPKAMECPAATTPCYSCRAFATTPAFLPQLEQERGDLEAQVALGEAAGRTHWVEANRRKLIKLTPITDLLRAGQTHQPMGKDKREYAPHERTGHMTPGQENQA